jgi:hypothetical protein
MAALTSTVPTAAGTVQTGAAVSASDTITAAQLGSLGAYLIVINAGASPDVVAVLDGGLTPAGNAGASGGGSVTNATTKVFYISPRSVNPTTGLVTVTHSFITTVTYVLLPIG